LLQAGLRTALVASGHATSLEGVRRQGGARHEIGAVFELNRLLAVRVDQTLQRGEFPLVLAGDCTASLGALAGLGGIAGSGARGEAGSGRVGIVWFDAHGDFNTPETTVSGYLGGMPLAAAVGRCWTSLCASIPGFGAVAESRVVLAGARALDAVEADQLHRSAMRVILGPRIRETGLRHALGPALDELRAGADSIYLHLDLDVLDPSVGRANVYEEPRGLTVEELEDAVRLVATRLRVRVATVSAYDPTYDAQGRIARAGLYAVGALADAIVR
jgi:arginase